MSYDWRWLRPEEIVEQGLPADKNYAQVVVLEGTIRVSVSHEIRTHTGLAEELQHLFEQGHADLKAGAHD